MGHENTAGRPIQEHDPRRQRANGLQMGISISTSQDLVCHCYHLFNSLLPPCAIASSCLSLSGTGVVNAFPDPTAWMSQPGGSSPIIGEYYDSLDRQHSCSVRRIITRPMHIWPELLTIVFAFHARSRASTRYFAGLFARSTAQTALRFYVSAMTSAKDSVINI